MHLSFCPVQKPGEGSCKMKMGNVAAGRIQGTCSGQAEEPKMVHSNWKKSIKSLLLS